MVHTVKSLTLAGMGQLEDGQLVPRVLPGEEIDLQPDGTPRIIEPVADRVKPPCRHFKSCGGCSMQHASDEYVLNWKKSVVERALSARGLPFPLRDVHTSPANSRRRAKLSGRRTKKGAMVGFHARGSDALVEVPDCMLLLPNLIAGFPALEALTVIAASRKSEVSLTVTDSLNGLDVLVETERALTEELRFELAGLAESSGFARLAWNDETVVTRLPPAQTFGAATVTPPAGAFLQATREGEAALVSAVLEIAAGAKTVADLFCGSGTFSLPLAAKSVVHAVEGDPEMIAALDKAWRHCTGLKTITTESRDLFRRPLEADELARFDCVVLDPPRPGAAAQIATLAEASVPKIAMVSCNPVTFARDAETLTSAGYVLDSVTIVDQFRWSHHVEMAGSFTLS